MELTRAKEADPTGGWGTDRGEGMFKLMIDIGCTGGKGFLASCRRNCGVHVGPITWKLNEISIAEARKAIRLLDEGVQETTRLMPPISIWEIVHVS
jgi:hypothetical protein